MSPCDCLPWGLISFFVWVSPAILDEGHPNGLFLEDFHKNLLPNKVIVPGSRVRTLTHLFWDPVNKKSLIELDEQPSGRRPTLAEVQDVCSRPQRGHGDLALELGFVHKRWGETAGMKGCRTLSGFCDSWVMRHYSLGLMSRASCEHAGAKRQVPPVP